MTVCIAAACDAGSDDRKLVLCTDRKVGGALGSAETMLKARALIKNWGCLTAGTDHEIHAIVSILRKHFRGAGTIDETTVAQLTRAALHERKRDKASELIQGKYGLSYDEFLATGKDKLPPDLFRSAIAEIESTHLGVDLIIVGFISRFPCMIETNGRGHVKIRENFAVVGEGAYLAQASLLHRGHSEMDTLSRALYSVYEAKKFAEGAPSVGKETLQTVMYADGRNELTSVKGDNLLEEQYKKFGPKKIVSDLKIEPDFWYKEK